MIVRMLMRVSTEEVYPVPTVAEVVERLRAGGWEVTRANEAWGVATRGSAAVLVPLDDGTPRWPDAVRRLVRAITEAADSAEDETADWLLLGQPAPWEGEE